MDDLISRQAAIELFADAHPLDYISQAYLERIKALPSAQLKVMRCRDCKWWDNEYRECHSPNWDTGTDEHFITPPGFFCGWVERRGEQNG